MNGNCVIFSSYSTNDFQRHNIFSNIANDAKLHCLRIDPVVDELKMLWHVNKSILMNYIIF